MELADNQFHAGVTIATSRASELAREHRETFINKGEVGTWSSFAYDVEFAPGDGYQLPIVPLAEDARPGSHTRGDNVPQNEPACITFFA